MSFESTLIHEVMNPEPATIRPEALLCEAAERMHGEDLSCLIVCPEDPGQGWGILTQKDLLGAMLDSGTDLAGLRVSDAMTHPCVTVAPHYDVATSMQLMRMLGVRRAPVVEGRQLVGFVSFTDFFRHAMDPRMRRCA